VTGLAALVLCAAPACAKQDGATPDTNLSPSAAPDQGTLITYPHEGDFWAQMLVEGKLTMNDGCLMIGDYMPYFDVTTTWDPTTQTITFDNGKSITVGEHYRGGGSSISLDEGDRQHQRESMERIEEVDGLKECVEATGARIVVFTHYAPG